MCKSTRSFNSNFGGLQGEYGGEVARGHASHKRRVYISLCFLDYRNFLSSSPTAPYPAQSSTQSSKLEQLQRITVTISQEKLPIPLLSKMQQFSESSSNFAQTNGETTPAASPWVINDTIPAESGFTLPINVPVPAQAPSTGIFEYIMPTQPPPTGVTIAPLNLERPTRVRSIWTIREVRSLVRLRDGGLGWTRIATHFNGKTPNACRKRYGRLKKVAGPILGARSGRGVSSLGGGTQVRIQHLVEELRDRIIEIIEDVQVPDPVTGFTAVSGTQNVSSPLHIRV